MSEAEPAIDLYACMTPNVLKVMLMLGELDLPFRVHHVRIGPVFGNGTHFNRAAPQDQPYARQRFVTQATRLCALCDKRLGEARYLAGDDYTIADVATFPWLWRHPSMLGLEASRYPHLQRWVTDIRERPGFQRIHGAYKQLVQLDMADLAVADADMMDRLMGRGRWFVDGDGA